MLTTRFRTGAGVLAALGASACAHIVPVTPAPAPPGGAAAITAADLRQKLSIYSDDSMMGREAGTVGDIKATRYIAQQARAMGLQPAGDSGGYYQWVPLVRRTVVETTPLTIGGKTFALWKDYVVIPTNGTSPQLDGAQVVYGGVAGDTTVHLPPAELAGKVVVLSMPPGGLRALRGATNRGSFTGAAAVAVSALDQIPPQFMRYLTAPRVMLEDPAAVAAPPNAPTTFLVSSRMATALLGRSPEGMTAGTAGGVIHGTITITQTAVPARNVVAILPGSDPKLRGEYVALGAHNDHLGIAPKALDHDSLRAYNDAVWQLEGRNPEGKRPTPAQLAAIHINVDSLHRIRPARMDSVYNGADDDGSGTVSVLEIAQSFARTPKKPRRSLLFVWHTAEEKGLYGSEYFTDHPTVARDSIVTQLNMDMVGRGDSTDIAGGGPYYLELVGSRRLSTELGDIVESVNRTEPHPMQFDYTYDRNGDPENIYCRSDHYEYARYGIPIVFFTTGLHQDYHQLTDEIQYIDFPHMARVDQLVHDVALKVANLDHRPVVDHPKPDPKAACRQ